MSYILDALRRADAERERGGVPGLHTQTMAEPGDEIDAGPPRGRGLKPWHWLAIGLAGGLAVAIAWTWRGDEAPPPVAALPPPSPMPIQPPAPPVAAPPAAEPAPAPAGPVAIAPMRAAPPPVASAAARAPAPATIPRYGSLAELPPELRSGLPALAFGGSIYSGTPANRLLIVNGQLVHEGDALGNGVVLEQIRPKAAVLVIRGQRVEIGL